MITFSRPVGPYSDTKELEYISALHQTGEELRRDGTIDALDIMHFLSSRHGVRVSQQVVTESIVLELAGGCTSSTDSDDKRRRIPPRLPGNNNDDGEDEEELRQKLVRGTTAGVDDDDNNQQPPPTPKIDMCQMLALLLIPFLRAGDLEGAGGLLGSGILGGGTSSRNRIRKRRDNDESDQPEELVRYVLRIALNNLLAELEPEQPQQQQQQQQQQPSSSSSLTPEGIWLTKDVLREILETFGESNIPSTLLDEMMKVAISFGENTSTDDPTTTTIQQQQGVYFDVTLFLHVLTADTQLYDPSNIDSKASTHYQDARKAQNHHLSNLYGKIGGTTTRFNRQRGDTRRRKRRSTIAFQPNHEIPTNSNAVPFQTIYTAANIDNNADTYRSLSWFTLVWVETVLIYFAYLLNTSWEIGLEEKYGCSNEYGCAIAESLINWFVVFIELMIMGLTWVFLATLGNATTSTTEDTLKEKIFTTCRTLLGIGIVSTITITTFFQESEWYFWDTRKIDLKQPAYWTAFLGGCFILGFQLHRLFSIYLDLPGTIGISGMERKERCTKMAAVCKVRTMMEHAILLHDNQYCNRLEPVEQKPPIAAAPSSTGTNTLQLSSMRSSVSRVVVESIKSNINTNKDTSKNHNFLNDKNDTATKGERYSTISKALMGYYKLQDATEEVGGILWAYERLWDGSLLYKEGIYFHGRLIAVNFTQFFIIALMMAWFFFYKDNIEVVLGEVDEHCPVRVEDLNSPTPLVDPDYNDTINGFVNVFNVNSTHFSPDDGYSYVEGQFPRYNGTHFDTPNQDKKVCYSTLMAGLPRPPGPLGGGANGTNATGLLANMTLGRFNETPPEGALGGGGGGGGLPSEGGGSPAGGGEGTTNVETGLGLLTGLLTGETTMEDPGGQGMNTGDAGPPLGGEMDGAMMPIDFMNVSIDDITTRLVINPGAAHNEFLEALDIQDWEYEIALSVGLVGAFLGTLSISLAYIPSFVSSVLKMRSGVLPSLKGNEITYGRFRSTPDQTAILFGMNFWGCFFTALSCFFLFGTFTFICVYEKSREYIITISSALIGMSATIMIKVVVMMLLRSSFYSGYYRKRPAASNIMNVVLECWSLGLSVGNVAARMAQLLIVTAFYVGRIDTPMLAPGVGDIMGNPLDPAPDAFKRDLLIHEAHRHPYIERLGLLYLLKLHNGKDFGTRAGAYWRLLFVLALMPWMRIYRVHPKVGIEDDDDSHNREDGDFSNNRNQEGRRQKRRSIFEKYDTVGALVAHEEEPGNNRNGGTPNQENSNNGLVGVHPLEIEHSLLVNARLMMQNRHLMAALRAAREELAKASISMDPTKEQEQLQALRAPATVTSTYWGLRLLSEDAPGRLVLSKKGLAYYNNSDQDAVVKILWQHLAKTERNTKKKNNLLRLTSKEGQRYDFLVRSKADRASIRQEIATKLEYYQYWVSGQSGIPPT